MACHGYCVPVSVYPHNHAELCAWPTGSGRLESSRGGGGVECYIIKVHDLYISVSSMCPADGCVQASCYITSGLVTAAKAALILRLGSYSLHPSQWSLGPTMAEPPSHYDLHPSGGPPPAADTTALGAQVLCDVTCVCRMGACCGTTLGHCSPPHTPPYSLFTCPTHPHHSSTLELLTLPSNPPKPCPSLNTCQQPTFVFQAAT